MLLKKRYNRKKAVAYAFEWAYLRNPKYYDFENLGGDCTNFTSQALYAGSGIMNHDPNFGWYYYDVNNRSPSWTSVEFLHRFLVNNKGVGPVAVEVDISQVVPGDFVQIAFDGEKFAHSPFIISVGDTPAPENILVAAHSEDANCRPLSTYDYSSARFLHITHVNFWDSKIKHSKWSKKT